MVDFVPLDGDPRPTASERVFLSVDDDDELNSNRVNMRPAEPKHSAISLETPESGSIPIPPGPLSRSSSKYEETEEPAAELPSFSDLFEFSPPGAQNCVPEAGTPLTSGYGQLSGGHCSRMESTHLPDVDEIAEKMAAVEPVEAVATVARSDLEYDLANRDAELSPKPRRRMTLGRLPRGSGEPADGWAMMLIKRGPAKCPLCCACLGLIITGAITGVGFAFTPMSIETDFSTFSKTDVEASATRDAFLESLLARDKGGRRLSRMDVVFDLVLGYSTLSGSNILSHEALIKIASFEEGLRNLPGWKDLCNRTYTQSHCNLGVSFARYALPSMKLRSDGILPSRMIFDGRGRDAVPAILTAALRIVEQSDLLATLMPKGFQVAEPTAASLRSLFRFRFHCCYLEDPVSVRKQLAGAIEDDWEDFLGESVLPYLQSNLLNEDSELRVYYTGTKLKQMEVMDAILGDLTYASGSFAFVLVYLTLHTKSLFLGPLALVIVFLSVPLAFLGFSVIAGSSEMNIASFLSIFLIVGLGADVVFVYMDFWRESERHSETEADRMAWTYWYGGKASLATTITTALSFFANLASVLKSLREFGMFMGMCVMFAWLLVTLLFVPLCAADSRYLKRCELNCTKRFCEGYNDHWGLLVWYTRRVDKAKWCLAIIGVFCAIGSLVVVIASAEADSQIPNIFPKDHNLNRGQEVFDLYQEMTVAWPDGRPMPPESLEVCSVSQFRAVDSTACATFWCEAGAAESTPVADTCTCFRKDMGLRGCSLSGILNYRMRVAGQLISKREQLAALADVVVSGHPADAGVSWPTSVPKIDVLSTRALAPLVIEEWETGQTTPGPFTELTLKYPLTRQSSQSSCGWDDLCFCGVRPCALSTSWAPLALKPQLANRRLAEATPAPLTVLPAHKRATIEVVFGIKLEPSTPLLGKREPGSSWEFDESFQPSKPWAQRNMLSLCLAPENLLVVESRCWIENFKDWVKTSRGDKFPVPEQWFEDTVNEFMSTQTLDLRPASNFAWLSEGKLVGTFFDFSVNMASNAPIKDVELYREAWDAYVTNSNAEASRFANGAFHTSELWVRFEARKELLSSTVTTLAIVIASSFLGMLVFTLDCSLSFAVVVATSGVIAMLAFFIVAVAKWPIGPIEAISLIVFIGYAVTYSLHIAHKYCDPGGLQAPLPDGLELVGARELRYRRTQFAIVSMGWAALGSAATTVGCSIFMIFCQLTIFTKLGSVVLVVTCVSIFMALGPLPAVLLIMGPAQTGCRWSTLTDLCEKATSLPGNFSRVQVRGDIQSHPREDAADQGKPVEAQLSDADPSVENSSDDAYLHEDRLSRGAQSDRVQHEPRAHQVPRSPRIVHRERAQSKMQRIEV